MKFLTYSMVFAPIKMPTIPAIPGSAGGAGNGSFKKVNIPPVMSPVKSARTVSLIIPSPTFLYFKLRNIINLFVTVYIIV